MATKTLSNDEILEAIDNKTVLELSELVKAFEERYGVTAAAPVAVAAGPAAGGDGAGAPAAAGGARRRVWQWRRDMASPPGPTAPPRPATPPR